MPALKNTPYSGVLAANKAVDKVLSQIAEFCLRSIKSEAHNNQPQTHFKSFSTSLSLSKLREARTTFDPAFTKNSAHAFPMPDDAPVMITTLFFI